MTNDGVVRTLRKQAFEMRVPNANRWGEEGDGVEALAAGRARGVVGKKHQ